MAGEPDIPITRPWFGPEEEALVLGAIRSGWVTQGPLVARFERELAAYLGVAEVVAVSNCTTALHLALIAAGVGPGDEVVCPSMSFIATANAIVHAGATPVFADVEATTYGLDPVAAAAAITPRTKAIMPAHQSVPADLAPLRALAAERGLTLIEDAAPAIGCAYAGRKIGAAGNLTCFSFHPRKVISMGEGGAIATGDPEVAARLRRLRAHGMSVSDRDRHAAAHVVIERYDEIGYNYRLTDLQAAIGIAQLGRLDEVLARRRALAARYDALLRAQVPWLVPPTCPPDRTHAYQSYIVRLRPGAPTDRDGVMAALLARGIATRRGIMAIHREHAYAHVASAPLPVTEAASAETLMLPLFPTMTEAEQDRVVAALAAIAEPAGARGGTMGAP